MPHKILKSLLPTEDAVNSFQRLCNTQIDEMRKYDAHMANVKKDPKTYHPYPPPGAHPDIMSAITTEGNDYNISFEIIDDTPVPTLADKKAALSASLNQATFAAQEKILPTPKRNLMAIKANKASSIKEADRTAQQAADTTALRAFDGAFAALSEYHAQCESDIYDLTEKTVDAYKLPAAPEGK